jgi:hypothetical protein
MGTKITDDYFEYDTVKYFRGAAENVKIGSYGIKRDPIGSKAHLEVQNSVKPEYLASRVEYILTIPVDWSAAANAGVQMAAPLNFWGLNGSANFALDFGAAAQEKLQLSKFLIVKANLENMLNQDAVNARNYLADEGGDGRICSAVWVGVDTDLAEHFSSYGLTSGSFSASGSGDLNFTVTGGSRGSQTISLSATGSTFAYLLEKVTNWSNHKTHVDDMKEDYHS